MSANIIELVLIWLLLLFDIPIFIDFFASFRTILAAMLPIFSDDSSLPDPLGPLPSLLDNSPLLLWIHLLFLRCLINDIRLDDSGVGLINNVLALHRVLPFQELLVRVRLL